MENLLEIISICKASVTISVNNHKDYYESVDRYIRDAESLSSGTIEDIGADVFAKMIELDTVIQIQAYKDTPVGFYLIYHYDLETAVNLMLEHLKKN